MARSADEIILTTSHAVAGQTIVKEIDVITAQCAYGMNVFRDFMAGIRDFVGGRSKSVEKVLADARVAVLADLRAEAAAVGADAVISMDLDYHELTGGGKSGMLLVVATGTAVRTSRS